MEREPLATPAVVSLTVRASRAVFWNVILVPVQALLMLLAAAVVARRLSLQEYTVYSLAMATITALVLGSDLGLTAMISRFTPVVRNGGAPALRRLLRRASTVRMAVVAVLMVAAAAAVSVPALRPVFPFGRRDLLLLFSVAAVQGFSRMQEYLLAGLLDRGSIGAVRVAVALAQPALVVAALSLGYGLTGILGALLATALLELALFGKRTASVLGRAPQETVAPLPADLAPRAIRFAAVSFAEKAASYLSSSAFVIFLLAGLGREAEVARFAVAGEFAARVLAALTIPFAGIVLPVFASLEARARPDHSALALRLHFVMLLLLVVPAAGLLTVLAGPLIAMVYSPRFLPAAPILQVLVPLLFVEYVAYAALLPALLTRERYRDILLSKIPMLAGTVAVAIVVPLWGAMGAALAYGCGRLLSALVLFALGAREFRYRFPLGFAAKVTAATAVGVTVVIGVRGPWATAGLWPLALIALGAAAFFAAYRLLGGMAAEDRIHIARGTPVFDRLVTYLL